MNADGVIVIDTELKTTKLEKQLEKLERKKSEKNIEIDTTTKNIEQTEEQLKSLDNQIKVIEKDYASLIKAKEKFEELMLKSDDELTQEDRIDLVSYEMMKGDTLFSEYQGQLDQIKAKQESLKKILDEQNLKLSKQKNAYKDIEDSIEDVNNKIVDEKNKLEEANQKTREMKLNNIKQQINETGKSIEGVINKVVRWGVALFGVRSIYNFITSSMNTLSGINQQIGADIQYIKFALATSLQPVIEAIIKLAYKLLAYTSYIAKAWFGVNLFANASTEAFEKTNKAVQGVNSSAKELKKTLAGFDEMNILQEDGSVTSGGGGGGVDIAVPSVDLSNWESVEIPKWLEWIGKNRDLILGFFSGLGGIITGIKIAELATGIGDIFTILGKMSGLQIFGMISGIAIIGVGIYDTIKNIIKYIQDPTWHNFLGIVEGLLIIVEGISIVLLSINFSSIVGWIGLVAGAIGLIVDKLLKEEDTAYKAKKAEEELKKAREDVFNATNEYAQAVDNADTAEKNLNDTLAKHGITTEDLNKIIEIGTDDYSKLNKEQREVFKAYMTLEGAQKTLYDAGEKLAETKKNQTKKEIELQLALAKTSKEYSIYKKTIYDFLRSNKITTEEASDYMLKAFNNLDNEAKRVFTQDIPNDIEWALDTTKFGEAWWKFETWWNSHMRNLDTTIDLEIVGQGPFMIDTTGINRFRAKGGIYYPNLPRLASGGIINRPGAGVPYHGANIGERGAEAVVPLTDSQQMELLGEAIGRYITVNANIVNTMNGRVISRELQKINNESDFAFNR